MQDNKKHGGKRQRAGRKPRFGVRMTQKTIRLPRPAIDRMIADYGSFQKAIEALASEYLTHPTSRS